jgi:histidinol-phosphate aminotransferase
MSLNTQILEKIRRVEPYVPGEQPKGKVVKLNTNENPYPPSPAVAEALNALNADSLRLYPDPACQPLVAELAKTYGVEEDQVFVGVGSDDVISMSFLTFFHSDKPILFPDISYSFYKVWAQLYRIPYETPSLDENFRIRREDYYRENGGIIFPNPNAPTAIWEDMDFIEDILQHNPDVVVIVDEAYVDFAGENASALKLLKKYDNLLIVQTFSKSRSLAGMRIGFAIGNPELIRYLNDAKYSFNSYTMSRPALACGVAALRDTDFFKKTIQNIVDTREWAAEEFKKLGFEMTESSANFLFVRHPECDGGELFDMLKQKQIYVRHWDSERISQYLRVTVGTREEMEILLSSLREYMTQK